MYKLIKNHNLEKGQIIVIVAVAMFALIAMAALILDGGALLVNKRAAQNAADAGALAGARVFCRQKTFDQTAVETAISQYAAENNATVIWGKPNTWIRTTNLEDIEGLVKGEVIVTVEVSHGSFFAKIFGLDYLTARADAGAGCFPYLAEVVLPIAYPCNPPQAEAETEGYDCDFFPLDWDVIEEVMGDEENDTPEDISTALYNHAGLFVKTDEYPDGYNKQIYVVVESELICGEDLECDFTTTDSINRYQLNSSERGWLNLTGGNSGVATFTGWIENGLPNALQNHIWLSFIRGESAVPGFGSLATRIDEVVYVPVFNTVCDGDPTTAEYASCWADAHKPPFDDYDTCEVLSGSPAYPLAHVVTFAPFFPTCVRIKKTDYCPGYDWVMKEGPNADLFDEKVSSFEGYFVLPESLEGDQTIPNGADIGVYIATLTR